MRQEFLQYLQKIMEMIFKFFKFLSLPPPILSILFLVYAADFICRFIHIFDTFCKLFIRLHDLLVLLLQFVFEHVVRDRFDKNKKFCYSLASLFFGIELKRSFFLTL
jgi:hypothetical protein